MAAPKLVLDHIVIGCATLEQGVAYLRHRLGVEVPPGGRHERMGTHNRLMQLGGRAYLELIAIDPHGVPPGRPRWFGLDEPAQQARLAERPHLIAWVAGTADIAASLAASPVDLGRAVEMTRGDLTWRISLHDDGTLPESGALPVLIEWPAGPHPSARQADLGVRLAALCVAHPAPERIAPALAALGASHLATLTRSEEMPMNTVELRTHDGATVTLD